MMSTTVTYKGSTIATVSNGTKTLKTAGTYMEDDVTLVDSTSGGTYQAKTNISPTTSSQTITPDSGYDALSSVQINAMPSGTEGTPTATKGTVSNNSVSVTPSVTNSAGYIAGGTKTGTAVTVSASELVSGTKSITANGTDIDVTNYASVDVSVSTTTWTTLYDGNLWITSSSPNYIIVNNFNTPLAANEVYRITWGNVTHTFTTEEDESGTSYDGYFVGNVGVVGGADDGSGIALLLYRDRADRIVGVTTDAAGTKYLKIEKQVSGGGGNYQAKTGITPTTSSQTITPDTGYDALESVQINAMPSGTAGTPTATKGTVSNHSVSVTPSVTNTTGYITGSTINGTAVSVSASELVSGSETKTANGTYDVTNLAELVVAVSGGASNVVTGTFKGTTTGAAMDVTLNYTGSGYPVAVMIYPSDTDIETFNSLIQRYAIRDYIMDKYKRALTPTYPSSGTVQDANRGMPMVKYKNSSSNSTNYSHGGSTGISEGVYYDTAASANTGSAVHIRSKTKMSVFIAGTSYGFAANIEYRYHVIYSS